MNNNKWFNIGIGVDIGILFCWVVFSQFSKSGLDGLLFFAFATMVLQLFYWVNHSKKQLTVDQSNKDKKTVLSWGHNK